MMKIKALVTAGVVAAVMAFGGAAQAQDQSYKPGSVWQFSMIQTEPGQFENYMDWLAGKWKDINEFSKKNGYIVSYHVFSVNNTRANEPDLILAIEYKDYVPVAEQLVIQKKIEAFMAQDQHKQDSASGERKSMRKLMGSMELQELLLK